MTPICSLSKGSGPTAIEWNFGCLKRLRVPSMRRFPAPWTVDPVVDAIPKNFHSSIENRRSTRYLSGFLKGCFMDFDLAKRAVITVGPGHGFVVAGPSETFHVITASHCLPYLPPAHPASPLEERTYANLLGHLGESPTVWAECLFADPVADIAVLGQPDSQSLYAENEAYCELMPDIPLAIADTPHDYKPIMIKTFDGEMIEAKDHYESLTTRA